VARGSEMSPLQSLIVPFSCLSLARTTIAISIYKLYDEECERRGVLTLYDTSCINIFIYIHSALEVYNAQCERLIGEEDPIILLL